jgi:hypothetical protein
VHTFYNFQFLDTVSQQLREALDNLQVTPLNAKTLAKLVQAQTKQHAAQGVYFLHLDGEPFYLGKADDVASRLREHLEKLKGRQGIDASKAGYKAILLDKSMSTAANEDILIKMFSVSHTGMWNNKGFGPKDPGQNRDTTIPSLFDRQHPIRADFVLEDILDTETIASLFQKMKGQLPYLFRYERDEEAYARTINLAGVVRTAQGLLESAIRSLPSGWHGAVLSFGMVVYKTDKSYGHASRVFRSPHL